MGAETVTCACGAAVRVKRTGECMRCYDRRRNPLRKAAISARNRQRYAEDAAWREELREKARARNTGMTPEMTQELRQKQRGLCAICSTELDQNNRRAANGEVADHCHATGRVRGLLCKTCNQFLAFFEAHGERAREYLRSRQISG